MACLQITLLPYLPNPLSPLHPTGGFALEKEGVKNSFHT